MAYDGPGGALFKNAKKQRDSHPDLQGNIELSQEAVQSVMDQVKSGVKYPKLDLSGWTKVSSKGNKFISLSAKKPWEKSGGGYDQGDRGGSSGGYNQGNNRNNDIDDEIPF